MLLNLRTEIKTGFQWRAEPVLRKPPGHSLFFASAVMGLLAENSHSPKSLHRDSQSTWNMLNVMLP